MLGYQEPRCLIAVGLPGHPGVRKHHVRRTILAIALGLTACAPTQQSDSGYKDASITQADELKCRDEASAAATRAYQIFGYRGHEDLAMDAYAHTFDRCMFGH